MNENTPEQAIAARLTAIAERLKERLIEEGDSSGWLLAPPELADELLAAVAQLADLRQENALLLDSANHWMELCLRAEQQRDAAHAALTKCRKYFGILSQRYNDAHQFTFSAECDGLVIELDAALAASAPQKE